MRFFFCLGGGVFSFCCLAGWRVFFFLYLGGVHVFLLLFGRVAFFFAVWAGDGSSLTYRSAWLVFKGPNYEKDQTAKKHTHTHTHTHRFPQDSQDPAA